MSTGSKKKRRIDRVTSLELPPGVLGNLWGHLRRGHVLVRLALCAFAAVLLWAVTRGWAPPLPFHRGDAPRRDVVARTQFEREDPEATRKAHDLARSLAIATYIQDPARLEQLRAKVDNEVAALTAAKSLKEVDKLWDSFRLPLAEDTPKPTAQEREQQYQKFREALAGDGALKFKTALNEAFAPLSQKGVLEKLPPEHDANAETIAVRPVGSEAGFEQKVPVSDVLAENVASALQKALQKKMPSLDVADRVFARLKAALPTTLTLDVDATRKEQKIRAAEVKTQTEVIPAGTVLAHAQDEHGNPLQIDDAAMQKLKLEYRAELDHLPFLARLSRTFAVLGMYIALYVLCGFYIYQREPRIIDDLGRLATLLALVVVTVTLIIVTANDWRAEMIPLMLFGMTVAIAYEQEIALLLSAAVTLITVVALGHGLSDAIVFLAATAGAILLLGRVRSRSKLLSVGVLAAGVAALTMIGVGTLEGHPISVTLKTAAFLCVWAVIAGSLMTCLLPMVEKLFNVQTDLSLIDLGDPAHPLLQELIRRAGDLQPFDYGGVAGRIGGRSDRGAGIVGSCRGVFSRHRQNAQTGLLRRKPGPGR